MAKYPTPEEAAKHASEAHVMMRHFEEAVKKIKTQREGKPGEKVTVPYYRWSEDQMGTNKQFLFLIFKIKIPYWSPSSYFYK